MTTRSHRSAATRVLLATGLGVVAATGFLSGCKAADADVATTEVAPATTLPAARLRIATRGRLVCTLRSGVEQLPAASRRGLIDHLLQYPDVTLATASERTQAELLHSRLVSAAEDGRWTDVRAAAASGFDTRTTARNAGDDSVHFFHAERSQEPRGSVILDPSRPKALIYADAPGHPPVLIGAMWSMRDGERGPNPGGPITRWHSHTVCARGERKGTKPLSGGKCRPGARLRQGRSEMMHVWFTGDLRSAFAIRAPEPELCAAGMLPHGHCRGVVARSTLEGHAGGPPTPAEPAPAIEAAFASESYAPGDTARLVVSSRAAGLRLQIFRSGPERAATRVSNTMKGIRVSPEVPIGSSSGRRVIPVQVGDWTSGLYFARVLASDGRGGFAPFVVRPRRLGEHRVAVVLPTLTWQAYNFRDDDGDGAADSWYADWGKKTVLLGRPYLNRGVPYGFRYHLAFLTWLHRTNRDVDVLSQSDLEAAESPRALARAYDLIVFPGHHEYVTAREYDLVEGYRDLGGNLMFLSANNFFWRVVRRGDVLTKTMRWRDLGRPEAALVGVQYVAHQRAPRRPWIIRASPAASWMFSGTLLRAGSSLARGGVEIDQVSAASPGGVQVVAEIPNLFGPGMTAQMTYYETRSGARVFAAGAFHLTRAILEDPGVWRMLDNLWVRLTWAERSSRPRAASYHR